MRRISALPTGAHLSFAPPKSPALFCSCMSALPPDRIAALLSPYLQPFGTPPPSVIFLQLAAYLDLLLKWNARTNLTAIRDPETIVTRHFGESLFLAAHLPQQARTVLDLGSGAGFPGLPLHLLRPDLNVTLAESQGKKSAFLREVVRPLDLTTLVHAGRAEDLVGRQHFDLVTLRAVDNMPSALQLARTLGTQQLVLTTKDGVPAHESRFTERVPGIAEGVLILLRAE